MEIDYVDIVFFLNDYYILSLPLYSLSLSLYSLSLYLSLSVNISLCSYRVIRRTLDWTNMPGCYFPKRLYRLLINVLW